MIEASREQEEQGRSSYHCELIARSAARLAVDQRQSKGHREGVPSKPPDATAPRARKRPASGSSSGVSPKPKRGGKAGGATAKKKNGKKAYKYCDDSSDDEPSEHESDYMDDE